MQAFGPPQITAAAHDAVLKSGIAARPHVGAQIAWFLNAIEAQKKSQAGNGLLGEPSLQQLLAAGGL
jgi:hypothetical protein